MNQIIVTIPPMFVPVVDELVQLNQAGSREQWLNQLVRGIVLDFQMRKDFAHAQQARAQQLASFWPGPEFPPQRPVLP